jgi:hypothetical protein
MVDDRQLKQKMEELFGESKETFEAKEDFDEVLFTERSELQDLNDQDVEEVAEYLKEQYAKKEAKQAKLPKQRWIWKFYGVWWFKIILFFVEFLALMLSLYFFVPLSINTSVTIIQALSGTTLLTILRQWMK